MTDYSCNISKFYERDIDIMLAEELRVNPDFSRWFVNQGGGGFECKHPAEWVDVSVVEDGSEADVVALFCDNSGKKYKLFIENKIDHTKGERQLERYIRRAQNELKRGEISDWSIKFFTPAAYSDRNCPDGVQNITFENAADFLKDSSNDARGAYKASFLSEAAIIRNQKERDNHTTETAPFVKEWWDAVYKKLEEEERFPNYFIHKTKYPRSVYFAPTTHGITEGFIRVDFKGHKGEVDLAFMDCDRDRLLEILEQLPEKPPGELIDNKKSTAIRISNLKKFVIADGKDIIETHVMPSYEATKTLLEFWKKYEKELRRAFD